MRAGAPRRRRDGVVQRMFAFARGLASAHRSLQVLLAAAIAAAGMGTSFAQSGAPASADRLAVGAALTQDNARLGEERVDLRTRRSRTFARRGEQGQSEFVTRLFPGSVNFRDGDGSWHPIDNRMIAASAPGYAFENAANRYRLLVPEALGGAPVIVRHGTDTLSMRLRGASDAPARADGATVRYDDVLAGVSALYTAGFDGVKEELVLDSRASASSFTFDVETGEGLSARETDDGGIAFVRGGATVMAFAPPTAFDSSENPRITDRVSLSLHRPAPGELSVTLRVDDEWLAAPERQFPVTVDPTTTINAQNDCFISSSAPTTTKCAEELEVGTDTGDAPTTDERALLRFDVATAIPREAIVASANLNLWAWSRRTTSTMTVSAHRLTKPWVNGAVTWSKYDATNSWTTAGGDFDATAAASNSSVGDGTAKWYTWYPSELVQGWVDRSVDNHGLILKGPGSSAPNMVEFSSNDFDATHRPYMDVKWKHRLGIRDHWTFESQKLSGDVKLDANVANGNLVVTEQGPDIAGTQLDLTLARYFNSLDAGGGNSYTHGRGWTMSPAQDVFVEEFDGGDTVRLKGPSDWTATFRKKNGTFQPSTGLDAALVKNADGTFKVTFHSSQEKLHFAGSGRLLRSEDRNGNQLTYEHNGPAGDMSKITDTRGRAVTFGFNADGYITSLTDSTGRQWKYGLTSYRNISYTNPANKVTSYAYTGDDLTKITDPRGNDTVIGYDTNDRVTSIKRITDKIAQTGPTTTFTYHATPQAPCAAADGHVGTTVVTDPRSNQTTYCWDRELRVTKAKDARGMIRSGKYTSNSNVEQYTSAGAQAWDFTYDTDNRPTKAQQPAAGTSSRLESKQGYSTTITNTSDPRYHQPTSSTDTQNNQTTYGYDAKGNQTSATNQLGTQNQVTATYHSNGNVDTITDARGKLTDFAYNTLGELTSIDRPTPLGTETFTYDALSRPDVLTDGRGKTADHDHDVLDRLTRIAYSDGSSVAYTFDDNGNMATRTESGATTTYTYDALNRLTQEQFPGGRTNSYTYDAASNLKTLVDSGGTTTYTYGPTNLLDALRAPGETADSTFAYDDDDRRTTTTYPNGVVMSQSYDNPGRLKEIKGVKGTTTLTKFAYTYIKGASDTNLRQTVTDHNAKTTTYTYDALNRLTRAQDTAGGTDDYQYTLDGNGNVTSRTKNGSTTAYSYSDANQLTQAGSTTYSYDDAGNLMSSSAGFAGTWNDKGQATSIKPEGGSTAFSMGYFGPNQFERVTAGSSSGTATFTHNVLGVGVRTIGTSTDYYTRDEQKRLVSQRLPDLSRHYYLFDGLGSIAAVTDATGTVGRRHSYDPYGYTTSSGTTPNPWRYAGEYQDSGSSSSNGLYKMGMRYYDPNIGRWIQQDPLDRPGDFRGNRYLYAGGDPANSVDPLGLHECDKAGPHAGPENNECSSPGGNQCIGADVPWHARCPPRRNRNSAAGPAYLVCSLLERVLTGRPQGTTPDVEGASYCGGLFGIEGGSGQLPDEYYG